MVRAWYFLGDKDQLESVGPGNVFKEMIESGVIPVTILTESFRQEGKSTIIQNADKINERKTNLVFDDTFQFYPATDDDRGMLELIQKALPGGTPKKRKPGRRGPGTFPAPERIRRPVQMH